ncbi:MAG: hypothetical protein PHW46_06390 [Candidatus Omnitrophica bacterium]|nr:hypothetical protein [Candidatus Omnitrophota bacterium]
MDKQGLFKFSFGCEAGEISEDVIITPFVPLKRFHKYCTVKASFSGRMYSSFTGERSGKKFSVIHCGMGDRFLGDAILLLETAKVERILFVGACGGLGDLGIGDIFVAENAFDGEGFTRYHKNGFDLDNIFNAGSLTGSDEGYTGLLRAFLSKRPRNENNVKYGNVFTIGSILAELDTTLQRIEAKGFKGVELEWSAVYHAAKSAGIKASALLFVSDLPLSKPLWGEMALFDKLVLKNSTEKVIKLGVEFVSYELPATSH